MRSGHCSPWLLRQALFVLMLSFSLWSQLQFLLGVAAPEDDRSKEQERPAPLGIDKEDTTGWVALAQADPLVSDSQSEGGIALPEAATYYFSQEQLKPKSKGRWLAGGPTGGRHATGEGDDAKRAWASNALPPELAADGAAPITRP